jgi:excisionase family DNA binding protein
VSGRALAKSEAAVRCGTSERTIERLIKNRKLRAHKVGARWKIFESDLDAYLGTCANLSLERSGEC